MHRKNTTRRPSHATIKSEVLCRHDTQYHKTGPQPLVAIVCIVCRNGKKAKAEGLKLRGPHTRSPTHTHNEKGGRWVFTQEIWPPDIRRGWPAQRPLLALRISGEPLFAGWHWQKAAGTPKTGHTFSSEYLALSILA